MNDFLMFNIFLVVFYGIYFLIRLKLSYRNRKLVLFSLPFFCWFSIALNELFLNSSGPVSDIVLELGVFDFQSVDILSEGSFSIWGLIYGLGVIVSFVFLVIKLIRAFWFFRKIDFEYINGVKVYYSDLSDSFNFFNRIHISESSRKNSIIMEHEMTHAKKHHTAEAMIIEIYQLIFWFNPIIYWLKYEMKQTQEFEVDEILFKKHKSAYVVTLVNYTLSHTSKKYLLTSQFYNQLSLAKRTKNMKNTKVRNSKWMLVIPMFALFLSVISCTKTEEKVVLTPEQMKSESVTMPVFNGGNEAMFKYLGENIIYPEQAKAEGVKGVVYVGFTVSDEGEVKDVDVKRGLHELLDAEAVRAIKSMPNWNPGTFEGKNANISMVLPINFSLE